jgi:hypothetical protein
VKTVIPAQAPHIRKASLGYCMAALDLTPASCSISRQYQVLTLAVTQASVTVIPCEGLLPATHATAATGNTRYHHATPTEITGNARDTRKYINHFMLLCSNQSVGIVPLQTKGHGVLTSSLPLLSVFQGITQLVRRK